MIKLLIDSGADVDAKDNYGCTSVAIAGLEIMSSDLSGEYKQKHFILQDTKGVLDEYLQAFRKGQ